MNREMIKLTILTCERCQHIWYPRIPTPPRACPNCNSKVWQRPKKEKKNPTD